MHYVGSHEKGLAVLQLPHTLLSEWTFSNTAIPRTNWSGFMQHAFSSCQGSTIKSELRLPIINFNQT